MRKIKKEDKIYSISHKDMDGVSCQIVLANVFPNIIFKTCAFGQLDRILPVIDYSLFDHVIITDVYPNDLTMLCEEKIILLDHHETSMPAHDPKHSRFVDTGQCAASLTKRFVETYFSIKMDFLDKFIWHVNDYDLYKIEDYKSVLLNCLLGYYKEDGFRNRFIGGNLEFNQNERDYLSKIQHDYSKIYDDLNVVELEKINGVIGIYQNNWAWLNEICHDLLYKDGYDIVFLYNQSKTVSCRHKIEGLHLGNLLDNLKIGGGHERSCGMYKCETIQEVIDKVKLVEKIILDKFPKTDKIPF